MSSYAVAAASVMGSPYAWAYRSRCPLVGRSTRGPSSVMSAVDVFEAALGTVRVQTTARSGGRLRSPLASSTAAGMAGKRVYSMPLGAISTGR